MAVVRATCETCGEIELVPQDVVVRVCLDDQRASYYFSCPTCAALIARPVGSRLVELLASSGSSVALWHLPAELTEAHPVGRLTHDDLLDFHELLSGDDWIDALIADR